MACVACAQAVLSELRKRGVTPTVTAYCFLLSVAASAFRLRRADALLSDMEAAGKLRELGAHATRVRSTLNVVVRA